MALDTKPAKYKGFTIRYSRGDWYVDDANGRVVASVWSKKDGKRWVDAQLKELEASRESNPARQHSGHMATCRHCEALIRKYEREGMTTSDAQGAAEAEHMRATERKASPAAKKDILYHGRRLVYLPLQRGWAIQEKDGSATYGYADTLTDAKWQVDQNRPREGNPVRKRANDLTAEAMEGYTGAPLKYIYSSPNWYAYKIDEYFRQTGRPEPTDVRMGRGYSINVRDMTFSFGKGDAITRVK